MSGYRGNGTDDPWAPDGAQDERFMRQALHEAQLALEEGETPVGAVVVHEGWRLTDATLYVTMEPCPMCTGAILLSRVRRVVYGARDARAGACGTRLDLVQANPFGHDLRLTDGCLADDCTALLQEFFRDLRSDDRSDPAG